MSIERASKKGQKKQAKQSPVKKIKLVKKNWVLLLDTLAPHQYVDPPLWITFSLLTFIKKGVNHGAP